MQRIDSEWTHQGGFDGDDAEVLPLNLLSLENWLKKVDATTKDQAKQSKDQAKQIKDDGKKAAKHFKMTKKSFEKMYQQFEELEKSNAKVLEDTRGKSK